MMTFDKELFNVLLTSLSYITCILKWTVFSPWITIMVLGKQKTFTKAEKSLWFLNVINFQKMWWGPLLWKVVAKTQIMWRLKYCMFSVNSDLNWHLSDNSLEFGVIMAIHSHKLHHSINSFSSFLWSKCFVFVFFAALWWKIWPCMQKNNKYFAFSDKICNL